MRREENSCEAQPACRQAGAKAFGRSRVWLRRNESKKESSKIPRSLLRGDSSVFAGDPGPAAYRRESGEEGEKKESPATPDWNRKLSKTDALLRSAAFALSYAGLSTVAKCENPLAKVDEPGEAKGLPQRGEHFGADGS